MERRVRYPDPFPHARRSALVEGFSLHAGVRIHGNDRAGLERLCRYALRPPLALQRLTRDEAGQLVYRMKRPRGSSLSPVVAASPAAVAGREAASGDSPSNVEPPRTYRVPWADPLKKVFALDVLACPACSGRLKLIAFIASEAVARRILDHLGLDATGPPLAPARAPDELFEPASTHDAVDPVYPD